MKRVFSEQVSALMAVTVPALGVVYAVYLSIVGTSTFDWFYIKLCIVLYVLTGLGITVGYHRLFTHQSFKTTKAVEFVFAVLGTCAMQGKLIWWCTWHTVHHQKNGKDEDPCSPWLHGYGFWRLCKGLLHAHILWIFKVGQPPKNLCSERLVKNTVTNFVDRTTPFWVILSYLIPSLIGYAHDPKNGLLLGFIWGACVRIFIVQHIMWSLNSYCQVFGKRVFSTHDYSRSSIVLGVLAFGDGFCNEHHKFPSSARHGFRYPWLDLSYGVIIMLQKLRLAHGVKGA